MIYRIPLISLTALALISVAPLTVLAADLPNTTAESKLSKSSDANVKITGGDLQLSSTGQFTFEDSTVKDIAATGATLSISTTENPQLTIHDYRGTHEGWQLLVSLDEFNAPNLPDHLSAELALNGTLAGDSFTPNQKIVSAKISSGPQTDNPSLQPVWKADSNTGEGKNIINFKDSTLKIHKNSKVSSGFHTAKLNWNLQSSQQKLATAQ